jgi:hypothetical protein
MKKVAHRTVERDCKLLVSFLNKSDSHLPLKQDFLARYMHPSNSFGPLETHGSPPSASRLIASSKTSYDL